MIKATQELLQYLEKQNSKAEMSMISAYSNAIMTYGGQEDGKAVADYLLDHQGNYSLYHLYEVVKKCGNKEIARTFFSQGINSVGLKDGFDLEILEVLGEFQLEEAKPMLIEYALGESDYYSNLHAVKGLLNYNCDDLQDRIRSSIEAIYNKNLFNEYLPAMVCKLKDRTDVLEKLYSTGTEYCSTDCNAGIFLGFSLCGDEGLPYFKKAMFDPAWEAYYLPRVSVVEGMHNLGITFSDLFLEIRSMADPKNQEYGLEILLSFLEVEITSDKMELLPRESFSDLMRVFFHLNNHKYSGDLIEFAEKFGKREEASKLEELLRLRLREEALFKCI